MSVIVLGMEMPKNCKDCFAYRNNAECDYAYCTISAVNVNEDSKARRNLCPLRPLPEKHGRLIDVDAMERLMSDTVQGDIRGYPYSDTQWDMAFKWLDHQPTIVEAEGD